MYKYTLTFLTSTEEKISQDMPALTLLTPTQAKISREKELLKDILGPLLLGFCLCIRRLIENGGKNCGGKKALRN
jgi:hypothetical protein